MDGKKLLKVFAVLFALLALSDFLKPFELSGTHGFVFLGVRLKGVGNLIAGPAFGLLLAAYAYGLWKLKRYALPLGLFYAFYVIINLAMFNIRMPEQVASAPVFAVVYTTLAVGVSGTAVYLLAKHRRLLS